jgi:hypothetical protein
MTTNSDVNQLELDPALVAEVIANVKAELARLGLKPIADADRASFARVSPEALVAYEAIAALAEQRPDIIPNGVCDPAFMRGDLSDYNLLDLLHALLIAQLALVADNRAAAMSDIVREGNAGYAIAARVAERDMEINAAIEPLKKHFKATRGRRR